MLIWAVEGWRLNARLPGDVVVISALTFRILHGWRYLALSLVDASQQFGVITDMLGMVAVPHEVADRPDAEPLAPLRPGTGRIGLEDVSFAYANGAAIFSRLSLAIPAGQRVGMVGPSGAGKLTLVRLIARVADPTGGQVLPDGRDIVGLRQDDLRRAVAVVPQDVNLLHRSVRDNLRYGSPDATDAQVIAAATAAHCNELIRALPAGYDTLVGERGTRLSGGQRQRIGIAPAMLRTPASCCSTRAPRHSTASRKAISSERSGV